METILVLAHTEADGSLGKAALETLGAAKSLSASLAGSALVESENTVLGGRIFRYEAPARWVDCGRLPQRDAVADHMAGRA